MKRPNNKIRTFLQLLGPLIFFYILFKIDYQLLFKEAKLLKWYFLVLASGIVIIEIIIRSLRWRAILSALGINISKIDSINLHWLGTFVGIITPGRFGELIKVYFLKNKGYNTFRSFFSIILDRFFDIFVLLFLGLLVFFFFLKEASIYIIVLGLILLLIIIFIFLLIDQRSFISKFFSRIIQKIFPVDFADYSRFTFSKLWQGIKGLKKKEVIYFLIYLIISWFSYFLVRYILTLSMDLSLSFIDITIISVLVTLVTILPISIAGLGTREAAFIYLFGLFGLTMEIALLFSLLVFSIDLAIISFGLIPYLKESSLINRIKSYESK